MQNADVLGFYGKFDFLSNFHEGYPLVLSEGLPWAGQPPLKSFSNFQWKTVEHAYQALKSVDPRDWQRVADMQYPGQAKRAGGARGFIVLRPDWEQVKHDIMLNLLRLKFTHYPQLRNKLLATGDALLVEVNTWNDRHWGAVQTLTGLQGENWLGRLLMQLRSELQVGNLE